MRAKPSAPSAARNELICGACDRSSTASSPSRARCCRSATGSRSICRWPTWRRSSSWLTDARRIRDRHPRLLRISRSPSRREGRVDPGDLEGAGRRPVARDRGGQRHSERALHASRRCTFAASRRSDCSPVIWSSAACFASSARTSTKPHGDPILSGARLARPEAVHVATATRSVRVERARLEGADEPDRRYDGEWAGLTGVDCVIVSARRKPDWTKGTFVITNDGWFTLGEPFDRPMPNGIAHGVSVDAADDTWTSCGRAFTTNCRRCGQSSIRLKPDTSSLKP